MLKTINVVLLFTLALMVSSQLMGCGAVHFEPVSPERAREPVASIQDVCDHAPVHRSIAYMPNGTPVVCY